MNNVDRTISIRAPADAVFDTILRPEDFSSFVGSIDSVDLCDTEPAESRYEWRINLAGAPMSLILDTAFSPPEQVIRSESVGGDLAHFECAWHVRSSGDESSLQLTCRYRLGMPIEFYVARTLHEEMTRFIEEILISVRQQVEPQGEST